MGKRSVIEATTHAQPVARLIKSQQGQDQDMQLRGLQGTLPFDFDHAPAMADTP